MFLFFELVVLLPFFWCKIVVCRRSQTFLEEFFFCQSRGYGVGVKKVSIVSITTPQIIRSPIANVRFHERRNPQTPTTVYTYVFKLNKVKLRLFNFEWVLLRSILKSSYCDSSLSKYFISDRKSVSPKSFPVRSFATRQFRREQFYLDHPSGIDFSKFQMILSKENNCFFFAPNHLKRRKNWFQTARGETICG